MNALFRLDGKIALVTGGARDIGGAISRGLAEAGADVVINYAHSGAEAEALVKQIEGLGRRAIAVKADVTKPEEVKQLADGAFTFGNGKVDILVNNAGGLIRRAGLADLDEQLLDDVLRLNFSSGVYMARAVIPRMVEAEAPCAVVNISSVAAINGGSATAHHYAASKAALANFSRSLTKEYAGKGVRINSVAPGAIDNGFHKVFTPREAFDKMAGGTPMGRAGTNEEVAAAAVFLASPAASYITGEMLHVNGGMYFGS